MTKVVTMIVMALEENSHTERGVTTFGDSQNCWRQQWTPNQIAEALSEMDPDDLDDLQQALYDRLWGPGGPFEHGRVVQPEDQ